MNDRIRVFLEVIDPFGFDLPVVRGLLGIEEASVIVAVEVDEERNRGRFTFRGNEWPEEHTGQDADSVLFRDQWKLPVFLHATEWLRGRPPSLPERLGQQEIEAYFVIQGYSGIIPRELLKEIMRLGIELEVLPAPELRDTEA